MQQRSQFDVRQYQAGRQACRHPGRQACRQAGRQVGKQVEGFLFMGPFVVHSGGLAYCLPACLPARQAGSQAGKHVLTRQIHGHAN